MSLGPGVKGLEFGLRDCTGSRFSEPTEQEPRLLLLADALGTWIIVSEHSHEMYDSQAFRYSMSLSISPVSSQREFWRFS